MLAIMKRIKEIDKDHNGYVTSTELSDIILISYPQLKSRNLKNLLRPFASIANNILVDYKRFRDQIISSLKTHKADVLAFLTKKVHEAV